MLLRSISWVWNTLQAAHVRVILHTCLCHLCVWAPSQWQHGTWSSLQNWAFTVSWSLLKLMSVESVMPSNHLILCHPLLLLPSTFPSIRSFPSESALHIWSPKYSYHLEPFENQALCHLNQWQGRHQLSATHCISQGPSRRLKPQQLVYQRINIKN